MDDDNFLSNFGPPPQPKLIKIDPPKHTVPDVTFLFDSNDSYLWKASTGSMNAVELPKDKIASSISNFAAASPITKLATLSKKVNAAEIESFKGQNAFPTHKNFPSPYHQNIKTQNNSPKKIQKVIYDPEAYRSPIHLENEISNLISNNNENCKGQSPVLKNKSSSVEPNLNVEIKFNEIKQNVWKSEKDNLTSYTKYHCYNQKHFFEANESSKINSRMHDNSSHGNKEKCDFFGEDNNVSPIPENINLLFKDKALADCTPKRKIDIHVLKILEEQKLQISQLQAVVEKVLNQQINTSDSNLKGSNSDKQCYCSNTQYSAIEDEKRKIAIVQTSFIEKPVTRTIATNTDLTMKDISLLINNETKFNMKQNCMRKNNSLRLIHKNSNSDSSIRSPLQSKQENRNNVIVDKLNEHYVKEIKEIIHSSDINTNEQKEYCEFEIETNEHPFFGESARNINKKYAEEEGSSELQKDEINNLTCYNNIQINIQQKFLQRTEPADEPKEENLFLVNRDLSIQQVEQQLQNFGISFLDPITLRNKGNDRYASELPAPFSFCPNYQHETALGKHDRAVYPFKNQESPTQNWKNVQMMLNKKYVNPNHEETSVLTSSTIQFFNKHGLKSRSCD